MSRSSICNCDQHSFCIKKVDESLLGGYILRVGDYYVDASLKTELDQKERDMISAITNYFDNLKRKVLEL